eukprot:5807694-Amphidinium_carterae.2
MARAAWNRNVDNEGEEQQRDEEQPSLNIYELIACLAATSSRPKLGGHRSCSLNLAVALWATLGAPSRSLAKHSQWTSPRTRVDRGEEPVMHVYSFCDSDARRTNAVLYV